MRLVRRLVEAVKPIRGLRNRVMTHLRVDATSDAPNGRQGDVWRRTNHLLTIPRFSGASRTNVKEIVMVRTAAPERTTLFLTRCNLEPSTPLHEVAEPAVTKPELAFRIAVDNLLGLAEQAVTRIKQGEGAEAGLCDLWAALSEMQAVVARDPGIRMAAGDLYEAAVAMVEAQSAGSGVGVRHWRLLGEAEMRLHDRMASARPRDTSTQAGWN
jgi:hypothetical protein